MIKLPKIALVYDRVNKFGGAERVLEALHQLYPSAPLYTSVYDPDATPWTHGWDVRPSGLNRFPPFRRRHSWLAPLMPYAFESLDLSTFDLAISVTSAEAKGILTQPHQLHLCYLLTPTRYLWSQTFNYQGRGVKRLFTAPYISSLRRWDYIAATRPDAYLAISQTAAARCRHYYRRQPQAVIYPPVATANFRLKTRSPQAHPYYLVVSRLVPYKRVDLAVKAFTHLPDQPLVIIGQGSQLSYLKRLAGVNITFLGSVTDDQLVAYYQHAQALIFPGEEDFGLSIIEAQAAGTPVIAYGRGGATETIIPGITGLFFNQPEVASLRRVLLESQSITWYHQACRHQAQSFDQRLFKLKFSQQVDTLWQQHQSHRSKS